MRVRQVLLSCLVAMVLCAPVRAEGEAAAAFALARKGKFDEALIQARFAVAANPTDAAVARLMQDLIRITDGRADPAQAISPAAPVLLRRGLAARLLPPAKAVPALRAVLGQEGAPRILRIDLAAAQLAQGKVTGAESDLKSYLSAHPKDVEALALIARVYTLRRRWNEAQAALDKALALAPGHPQAATAAAALCIARLDGVGARRALEDALVIHPEHPVLLRALAEDQVRTAAYEAAVANLRQVLELPVDHAHTHARISELYRALGRLPEAEASAKAALAIDPRNPRALRTLGFVLQKRDDFPAALERYRAAARFRPDWCQIHVDVGFVLTLMGQRREAEKAIEHALELDRHHIEAHLKRGILYFLEDEHKRAKQHFATVLKADGDNVAANRYMGYTLLAQGKSKAALKHFEKVSQLDPGDAASVRMMGRAYLEAGKLERAVEAFQLAVSRDPKNAWAQFDLGKGYEQQENWADAEKAYRKAIELDARFTYPHLYLAELLDQVLDKPEEALAQYKKYLELGGEDPDGDVEKRVKNLEKP